MRAGSVTSAVVGAMVAGLVLAAPAAAQPPAEQTEVSAEGVSVEGSGPRYVALGDSRAAGPFIDTLSHRDLCMRSDQNYAAKLARALDASSFTDVTCIAARSENIVDTPQRLPGVVRPPQIEALGPDTELVTLSIGGVDSNHVVVTRENCATPVPGLDRRCRDDEKTLRDAEEGIAQAAPKIDRAVAAVREAAPNARIFLVGHGGAVGPRGCWPSIPYSDADAQFLVDYFDRFNQIYRDLVDRYDVDFVDIGRAAVDGGHDPCAEPGEKWFEGLIPTDSAQPGHFNERGMQAVADMIAAELQY
ncbi:Lysophospholipase L1 [Rhodococcus triatomae]|uniref:Lysophospholipase L1 n=1 Tax=Rhodococcus triatomae TaxID=300028 RepID=A0A1G8DMX6_9NOCA|nr:SGNH/GDSL hydrolase family protein [Rhodococcus triatomae]SDH58955.1 Lysophospholipase L1 [Rhodococcus triatomae]